MKYILTAAFTALASLSLSACSDHSNHDGHMEHDKMAHHKMEKGIEISSAYVQPPFPGRDVAAGFFEITNHGPADRLLAVTSPISDKVEIHTHLKEDGVMKMRKIDGVDLPMGETLTFKPGSYHIMMFDVALPENQDDVALTLTYENADAVTIIAPLGAPNEGGDHSGH